MESKVADAGADAGADAAHAAVAAIPKITQPWLVPFERWRREYAYVIDCVSDNLRTVLSSSGSTSAITFDWVGMREDLARYMYATGHSRFRSFRHHCGPRETAAAPTP